MPKNFRKGDYVPEKISCVFCDRLDLFVTPIGENKGVCNMCAEKLMDMLIHTKKGDDEVRNITFGIATQIGEHKSKDHK